MPTPDLTTIFGSSCQQRVRTIHHKALRAILLNGIESTPCSKKTYVDLIIDYGVEDPELREYNVSINVGIDVFEMMQEAKKQFDDFTFEFTTFFELGHFINSINGLAGSTTDKTYWSFENRNGVPFDRGVDWIKVHYDDAIKFRFTTYNSTTDHP
ncbi:hypothetical protein Bbelb_308600 [Branchiostoma belcheri]|nr:hypothetical protein Bbelb_308600 [Branchiostoma belcheri]